MVIQSSCFFFKGRKKLVIFPIFWSSGFYVYQLDSVIMQEWYFISFDYDPTTHFNLCEFLVHYIEDSLR